MIILTYLLDLFLIKKESKSDIDISNVCNKRIKSVSSEEEDEDEGQGFADLVKEIREIQVDTNKNQIFDDFEELFETANLEGACKDFQVVDEEKQKQNEQKKKNALNSQRKQLLPSFTGLSVIQKDQ